MKILIVFIILTTVSLESSGMEVSWGRFTCKTGGYLKIYNGDIDAHNINTSFATKDTYDYIPVYSSNKDSIIFVTKRTPKRTYMFAYDENEQELFRRRIPNDVLDTNLRDLEWNRETVFKFKDQTILGLNFVCRM